MASKSLTFDIFGRDKTASKTMQGVGKNADDMGKKLAKVGKGMALGLAAAGAGAVAFGVESVKAFAEAEKAQAKLSDAFDRFPELADTNMAALQGLNSELAKKTRFDDDATAAAQATLAQYKLTGKQIIRLTPLMQDFAAKTGRDLPDAAKVLGKAMLGQGRALKEVGINFKDTKELAGNFDQVIDGLSAKVGGFAEKEGKTASGRLEILKNRFGEVQEKIGEAMIPALGEAADAMDTTFMPAIEDAADYMATTGIPKLVEFAHGFEAVQKASYEFGYNMAENLRPGYEALFKFGQDIEPIISKFSNFWQDVGYNVAEAINNPATRDVWGNDIMGDGKTADPLDPGFGASGSPRRPPGTLPSPTIGGTHGTKGKLPGLASGGTALAAGMALIGERGPELIHMPKGASVIPLDRAGAGGGPSFTQNIYPAAGMSEETIGRIAANSLNAKLRRKR